MLRISEGHTVELFAKISSIILSVFFRRTAHGGVKYSCGQFSKAFTSQSSCAEHRRAVHEGVKHPCK